MQRARCCASRSRPVRFQGSSASRPELAAASKPGHHPSQAALGERSTTPLATLLLPRMLPGRGTSRSGRAVCCNTGVPERRERRREIVGEGARVCVARTVAASLRTPSRCTPDRGSRPRRRRRCTPPARLERAGANSGGDRRRRPPHLHAVTPITRTSDKIPVNPM